MASKWSRPILRNLWGNERIKSLGKNHVYNEDWEKKLRISKNNFTAFKAYFGAGAAKFYVKAMRKGEQFFLNGQFLEIITTYIQILIVALLKQKFMFLLIIFAEALAGLL